MSANPHANGGLLLRDLRLPDFRDYAVAVPQPGAVDAEATRVQGEFIRDVIKLQSATTSGSSARTKRLEPLERGLRGDQSLFDRRDPARATITSRPTAA